MNWKKEKQLMEELYYRLTFEEVKVLDCKSSEIGYTVEKPYIYLSERNVIVDQLPENEKRVFRFGVFWHEAGHRIFSDFSVKKNSLPKEPALRTLFLQIENIMEDPAIEFLITHLLSENHSKSLLYAIQKTYELSESIEKISYALGQVLAAMIQYGDRGPVKGNFTFPEAEEVFEKVKPLMDACTVCKHAKQRFDYVKQAYELIRPLWKEALDSAKTAILLKNQVSVETQCGKALPVAILLKKDEPCPLGNQETVPITEEELQQLSELLKEKADKGVDSLKEQLEKKEEKGKREDVGKIVSPFFDEEKLNIKITKGKVSETELVRYDNWISDNEESVSELKELFSEYFTTMARMHVWGDSGKINEQRYLQKNTSRIFERHRRIKKTEHDYCLYLLVDNSGSMYGEKIFYATETVLKIAVAATEFGLPVFVSSFRCDSEYDSIITEYVSDKEQEREDLASLLSMKADGRNFDSHAMRYAGEILKQQNAKKKVLIVIHDGIPSGPYGMEDGIEDCRLAVEELKNVQIETLGISLECSTVTAFERMYGENYIYIEDSEELSECLRSLLEKTMQS